MKRPVKETQQEEEKWYGGLDEEQKVDQRWMQVTVLRMEHAGEELLNKNVKETMLKELRTLQHGIESYAVSLELQCPSLHDPPRFIGEADVLLRAEGVLAQNAESKAPQAQKVRYIHLCAEKLIRSLKAQHTRHEQAIQEMQCLFKCFFGTMKKTFRSNFDVLVHALRTLKQQKALSDAALMSHHRVTETQIRSESKRHWEQVHAWWLTMSKYQKGILLLLEHPNLTKPDKHEAEKATHTIRRLLRSSDLHLFAMEQYMRDPFIAIGVPLPFQEQAPEEEPKEKLLPLPHSQAQDDRKYDTDDDEEDDENEEEEDEEDENENEKRREIKKDKDNTQQQILIEAGNPNTLSTDDSDDDEDSSSNKSQENNKNRFLKMMMQADGGLKRQEQQQEEKEQKEKESKGEKEDIQRELRAGRIVERLQRLVVAWQKHIHGYLGLLNKIRAFAKRDYQDLVQKINKQQEVVKEKREHWSSLQSEELAAISQVKHSEDLTNGKMQYTMGLNAQLATAKLSLDREVLKFQGLEEEKQRKETLWIAATVVVPDDMAEEFGRAESMLLTRGYMAKKELETKLVATKQAFQEKAAQAIKKQIIKYTGSATKLQAQRHEIQQKTWFLYEAKYKTQKPELADTETHILHLIFQSVSIPQVAADLQSLGTCLQGAVHNFEAHTETQRQLLCTEFLKRYIRTARKVADLAADLSIQNEELNS